MDGLMHDNRALMTRTLVELFSAQRRVIGALMLREIQLRWGRRNLSFAWLFCEPLVFAFPVILMWSYIRAPVDRGLPMIGFVWSGYLPILLFRHVVSNGILMFTSNSAIFYHRVVTPFDLFVARCGLEAFGNLASTIFSFFVLYQLGTMEWPQDIPLLFLGFAYMTWWSLAVALIIAALSERSELVIHIWMPVSYIYLAVSGFMFANAWLPTPIRNIALTVMPSTHAYDMIRAGLFGNRFEWFYNVGYLSCFLAILTLIGFWLLRDVRKYMQVL